MSIQEETIQAFDEKVIIKRVLGAFTGSEKSPTVIFFGGIHGNEAAGIIALKKVIDELQEKNIAHKGNFYAIAGNIEALKASKRYIDVDLNRIWTEEQLQNDIGRLGSELNERNEIYTAIKEIVETHKGPFYFIDLHTTSSETKPFITISDSLNNRKFSKTFSIPTILGIEEFLEGPLLTYINEFGHVALGFEAGQHDRERSVDNCIAFIWLALVTSGCLKKKQLKKYSFYQHYLTAFNSKQEFFEIDYKYQIQPQEHFEMLKGFTNFEPVYREQDLAVSNGHLVEAPMDGNIFMPLYQKQGEDGFFIITKISKFWMNFSILVRRLKLYHVLRILPGITMDKSNAHTLIVNPKTATFLRTEIFHLFGFRKKLVKNNRIYFIRRDRKVSEFN